jgi:hypothetical protein
VFVTVHPSCVQVASTGRERGGARARQQEHPGDRLDHRGPALAGERGTRHRDVHAPVVKRPAMVPSVEMLPPLGDVGDPPPQAVNNVANVAPEAT